MVQIDSTYWYGVTATVYLVTCWVFSVVRGVHNCGTPKERRAYIWPDRKMQVIIYLCGTVLLPYVLNPQNEAAWILMKSYFPCTYYFYCGALRGLEHRRDRGKYQHDRLCQCRHVAS